MGKSTISMVIFNSYFDITRGYPMVFQIKSSFVAVQNHHRMGLQDGAPMDRQPSATPSTASVERNHSGALQAWLPVRLQRREFGGAKKHDLDKKKVRNIIYGLNGLSKKWANYHPKLTVYPRFSLSNVYQCFLNWNGTFGSFFGGIGLFLV